MELRDDQLARSRHHDGRRRGTARGNHPARCRLPGLDRTPRRDVVPGSDDLHARHPAVHHHRARLRGPGDGCCSISTSRSATGSSKMEDLYRVGETIVRERNDLDTVSAWPCIASRDRLIEFLADTATQEKAIHGARTMVLLQQDQRGPLVDALTQISSGTDTAHAVRTLLQTTRNPAPMRTDLASLRPPRRRGPTPIAVVATG